jgi:hypothetical protein
MNTNIEITNVNKHFFLDSKTYKYEQNKGIKESKKYNTKMVSYCFNTINEANISDKVKKIRYYTNSYAVVEEYDFITISQLNEEITEKQNLTDKNKYLIFKYKNEKIISFNDFLLNIDSPKLFILHTIESFSYLLHSLIQLNDNNICFFNLSPQNIGFNLDCGEKPIIQNFSNSLQISKLSESYITNIINKLDTYTHKPLEVHILFYLIKNDIITISYSFIEEITNVFMKNLGVLTLFSENYKESYKTGSIEYLKKYINKPKTDIIHDILEDHDKWDVYSLSLLYLHIFGNISRVFSLKQNFISKIIIELTKNISVDPSKRSSLEDLLENIENILNNEKNWSFVNKLAPSKMPLLMDILGK